MIISFLSGLGADEQAFQKLSLPTNRTINYLKWLAMTPLKHLKATC